MSGAVAAYVGTVRHRRVEPMVRQFEQRLFLTYMDVERLPGSLDGLPGWSARGPAPVHFRREDFFDGKLGTARRRRAAPRARAPGSSSCGHRAPARAPAHLRVAVQPAVGVLLLRRGRPRSSRRSSSRSRAPRGGSGTGTSSTPSARQPPHRCPRRCTSRRSCRWSSTTTSSGRRPGPSFRLAITVSRNDTTVFSAELRLRRRALDRRSATRLLVSHPLLPLRVSLGIYRRALLLALARVPVHPRRAPSTQKVSA